MTLRCRYGHDLTTVGTYTNPKSNVVECRECRRLRQREWRARVRDLRARAKRGEDAIAPVKRERLPRGKASGEGHEERELATWHRRVIDADAYLEKPWNEGEGFVLEVFAERAIGRAA